MSAGDDDWKRQLEKVKVFQRCPSCGELSLKFSGGKIRCSGCGFEQDTKNIE